MDKEEIYKITNSKEWLEEKKDKGLFKDSLLACVGLLGFASTSYAILGSEDNNLLVYALAVTNLFFSIHMGKKVTNDLNSNLDDAENTENNQNTSDYTKKRKK